MSPARPRATMTVALLFALLSVVALIGLTTSGADAQDGPATDGPPTGEPAQPAVQTGRLAGETRIETAVAIAQRAFPVRSNTVYLANATTMADAVAGGALTDGPTLLVQGCELPQVVADELARLQPDEIIALGGPAAVCDEVLAAAADAARGGSPQPVDLYEHDVTAEVEVVDATSTPPFSVDVTDPGFVFEGGSFAHEVSFTGTDGTIALDDPRFSGVLRDGDGQMVVTGRGCGPTAGDGTSDGEPQIACQEDFLIVVVNEGEATTTELTLHTDDRQVGDTPLLEGTYVLDQVVHWDIENTDGEVMFDDGQATIRVTYTVRAASAR